MLTTSEPNVVSHKERVFKPVLCVLTLAFGSIFLRGSNHNLQGKRRDPWEKLGLIREGKGERDLGHVRERREEVYLQVQWRRDELIDQLHLVENVRIGVKTRRGGEEMRKIRDHFSFPRLDFKVLQTQQGVNPQIWLPTSTTDSDALQRLCMHLQRGQEHTHADALRTHSSVIDEQGPELLRRVFERKVWIRR